MRIAVSHGLSLVITLIFTLSGRHYLYHTDVEVEKERAYMAGLRFKFRFIDFKVSFLFLPSSFISSLPCLLHGLPGWPAGKEFTCNAGDPSSIPGSGSSPGEGIGYPIQYSWASLVA